MSIEHQIHCIKVQREDLAEHDTGGAYRVHHIDIIVDKSLPSRRQERGVVHEVLGAYLGTVVDVGTLQEIAESVCSALEDLRFLQC